MARSSPAGCGAPWSCHVGRRFLPHVVDVENAVQRDRRLRLRAPAKNAPATAKATHVFFICISSLKRTQHQGLQQGVTGADLFWLALMPSTSFTKLGLILTEFDDPGKNRRQETPNSRCLLWVPRNSVAHAAEGGFRHEKGRRGAPFSLRPGPGNPARRPQNVCRMPIWRLRLSSPKLPVQPPTQQAAPSAARAWSLLLPARRPHTARCASTDSGSKRCRRSRPWRPRWPTHCARSPRHGCRRAADVRS